MERDPLVFVVVHDASAAERNTLLAADQLDVGGEAAGEQEHDSRGQRGPHTGSGGHGCLGRWPMAEQERASPSLQASLQLAGLPLSSARW